LLAVILSSPALADDLNQTAKSATIPKQYDIILSKRPLPKDATKLFHLSYFPNTNLEEKGIYLFQAIDMCMDPAKNFYILDYKAHTIVKFSEKGDFLFGFGKYGQGPGEVINPTHIFCDIVGYIYVADQGNGRLNIYNYSGEYRSSFKIFNSYLNYLVDNEGKHIYANNFRDNAKVGSLIEVLTLDGERIYSFGNGNIFRNNSDFHNTIYLLKDKSDNVYAIWKFFNIIKKYSPKGILLEEKRINNRLFDEISALNERHMILKDGGLGGLRLFSDVFICGDKLYLLRTNPRLEIYECSMDGNIERVYWNDDEKPFTAMKLLVIKKDSYINFYVLRVSPECRVELYSTNKPNNS
jgi:hypothetical protein